MKSANDLLHFFDYPNLFEEDFFIHHLSLDSRFQEQQWAFIAYQGQHHNGNHYIQSAITQGAVLILSDSMASTDIDNTRVIYIRDLYQHIAQLASWFYDSPSKQLPVTAVTGTNGKSSVAALYAQLKQHLNQPSGMIGTLGAGVWPDLDNTTLTTPDPISLQRIIHHLGKTAHSIVMEASSHALDQGRLDAVAVDQAIWTNLSHDHLDYHPSSKAYFQAKSRLFYFESVHTAIINIDDDYGCQLIEQLKKTTNKRLVTYGLDNPKADLHISDHSPSQNGYDFTLTWQNQPYKLSTRLMGVFNLYNLAATLLACICEGIALKKLLPIIEQLRPVNGRMQQYQQAGFATVVIDYAHTPDALNKALLTLKQHTKGQLWCVFGCGGDRDRAKRPKMAQIAQKLADNIVVTEDNNRFETGQSIINDIIQGFTDEALYQIISDRTEAIHYALQNADKNDIILLAGKGHERYIDNQGEKRYYNEEEIIQNFWDRSPC